MVSSSHGPAAGGRRRASLSLLRARGVDAFEPVANLHRCYLRQDPVFLRSLLRLVGRRVDRRFYFGHLLPGAQRGRAYVLLRNSFSGKWGSFAQQRPLALSSVRRLQPPCNVTVRHQDALAYLRALPCLAHQCIYADPPYIFPGRSMNYYGTRGATTWSFTRSCETHSSRVACPSSSASTTRRRPGSSTAGPTPSQACGQEQFQARAARTAPGQSCCHSRIEGSNPVAAAGLTRTILCLRQD